MMVMYSLTLAYQTLRQSNDWQEDRQRPELPAQYCVVPCLTDFTIMYLASERRTLLTLRTSLSVPLNHVTKQYIDVSIID